jgi:protein-disulfide isomerase
MSAGAGLSRRTLMALAALAPAGFAFAAPKPAPKPGAQKPPSPDRFDMALGSPKARVTLIEYASLSCGHCRRFNTEVAAPLKAKYLKAGKVRFVFREFRTPPEIMALAGFQLARCNAADPETYFNRLDVLFAEQPNILEAGQKGSALAKYEEIAARFGVSNAAFEACLNDPAGADRISEVELAGVQRFAINSTPTVMLNGAVVPLEDHTLDAMTRRIEALLKKR